jgi:hypothetical protein
MIGSEALHRFHVWFDRYVRRFDSPDAELQCNIRMKIEHSKNVCAEISALGLNIGLDEPGLRFAETVALFHDIGRFEQLSRYGTFLDHHSVDHAELGVSVLSSEGVLNILPPADRDSVRAVICNHNRFAIPDGESGLRLTQSRLLRDADKLDIFRILIDYYRNGGGENNTVALGLSENSEISQAVLDDLRAGRLVAMKHLRTINDFKLMKMGWVYDLNFAPSFEAVAARGYLEAIRDTLPDGSEVRQAVAQVRTYLASRCGNHSNTAAGLISDG